MKALAIRQPYAWLIVHGYKDVENRNWKTKHRGPLLIHASQKLADDETICRLGDWCDDNQIPFPDEVDVGGIVGLVELIDCVNGQDNPEILDNQWFFGRYGFVLANARLVPFMPFKGKLGIFQTDLTLEDFME